LALPTNAALLYFRYYRPKRRSEQKQAGEPVEELPIPGKSNQELKEQEQTRKPHPASGATADERKTA
jgi:hypothetical protein